MGIDITRLQQKKADGSYDIVHPETQAKAVWMSDGRSVEEAVGAGGGGGDAFVVTANMSYGSGSEVLISNPSHTYAEIYAAINAGKTVVLELIENKEAGTASYRYIYTGYGSSGALYFGNASDAFEVVATLYSNGSWECFWRDYVISGYQPYGYLYAGDDYQSANTSCLRNSKLVSTDTTPTVEGEIFWTYG